MTTLDFSTYRFYEKIAKSQLPNWRIQALFNLDVFQKTGFPIRIESNLELRTIIDTMQEERFEPILNELHGLSEEEYERYLNALESNVRLQLQMYPHLEPLPPFDAMLHALLVNLRLESLKPEFKSLLEIGPGCGYNSFYLKDKNTLENYSVTDACESFYLLQNQVNQYCFGNNYEQKVPLDLNYNGPEINRKLGLSDITLTEIDDHSCNIVNNNVIKCSHYPWWQLGNLYDNESTFDIVMSNSNLLEFSKGALVYYLDFIHKKLDSNGYFTVIGSGYYATIEEFEQLNEFIYKAGFAPIMLLQGTADIYDLNSIGKFFDQEETVILAPFSEKVRRYLYEYLEETLTGKKIIIVDDNITSHEDFPECQFMTTDAFNNSNISAKAMVGTYTDSLREKFTHVFESKNIETISLDDKITDPIQFCMWNAVFVNSKHKLYEKYHDMKYFRRPYFVAKEMDLETLYLRNDINNKKVFSKDDVKKDLEKRFL